jgi:hypothetical protein
VNWVGTEHAEKMIIEGIHRAASAGDDVAAHYVAQSSMAAASRASRRSKKK